MLLDVGRELRLPAHDLLAARGQEAEGGGKVPPPAAAQGTTGAAKRGSGRARNAEGRSSCTKGGRVGASRVWRPHHCWEVAPPRLPSPLEMPTAGAALPAAPHRPRAPRHTKGIAGHCSHPSPRPAFAALPQPPSSAPATAAPHLPPPSCPSHTHSLSTRIRGTINTISTCTLRRPVFSGQPPPPHPTPSSNSQQSDQQHRWPAAP